MNDDDTEVIWVDITATASDVTVIDKFSLVHQIIGYDSAINVTFISTMYISQGSIDSGVFFFRIPVILKMASFNRVRWVQIHYLYYKWWPLTNALRKFRKNKYSIN